MMERANRKHFAYRFRRQRCAKRDIKCQRSVYCACEYHNNQGSKHNIRGRMRRVLLPSETAMSVPSPSSSRGSHYTRSHTLAQVVGVESLASVMVIRVRSRVRARVCLSAIAIVRYYMREFVHKHSAYTRTHTREHPWQTLTPARTCERERGLLAQQVTCTIFVYIYRFTTLVHGRMQIC